MAGAVVVAAGCCVVVVAASWAAATRGTRQHARAATRQDGEGGAGRTSRANLRDATRLPESGGLAGARGRSRWCGRRRCRRWSVRAVDGAAPAPDPGRLEAPEVRSAGGQQPSHGRPEVPVQRARPRGSSSEPAGRAGSSPARHRISSTSRLPEAGDPGLVEQPGLHRRRAARPAPPAAARRDDRQGVGAEPPTSGSSCDATEPAGVVDAAGGAVVEAEARSGPTRASSRSAAVLELVDGGRRRRPPAGRSCRSGARASGPSVSSSSSLPMRPRAGDLPAR